MGTTMTTKTKSSQNQSLKWWFFENSRNTYYIHISCGHRDPQKNTSLAGTRFFDVFFVNIRLGVYSVGSSELQEPKNQLKTSHPR